MYELITIGCSFFGGALGTWIGLRAWRRGMLREVERNLKVMQKTACVESEWHSLARELAEHDGREARNPTQT